MSEEASISGWTDAVLRLTLRAGVRTLFVWLTASYFHMLELRPWALFIVFFTLGFGSFTFLSTKPRGPRLRQFHMMYLRYQRYMLEHPRERPKAMPIQWISISAGALASSLVWAWFVVLISYFLFRDTEARRFELIWLIITLVDWVPRLVRCFNQGQAGIHGLPFDEAFDRVAQVVRGMPHEDRE